MLVNYLLSFLCRCFFSFLLFCSFYHMKSGIFLSKIILTRNGKERVIHDKNRRRRESNNLGRTKAKNYLSHYRFFFYMSRLMKRTWIYCYHNYTTTDIFSPWKENRIQSPETMFSFSKSESIFRKWDRLFYFIFGSRGFRPS